MHKENHVQYSFLRIWFHSEICHIVDKKNSSEYGNCQLKMYFVFVP